MAHRIDAAKIAAGQTAKTAIAAAVTRLQAIETGYSTMTAAQKNAAIVDIAKFLRHVIRLVT